MNFMSIIACLMIGLGALIMAINIFKFGAILYRLNQFAIQERSKIRRLFFLHQLLMVFFLAGYLVVLIAAIAKIGFIGELFVGIIFFFGAIFVFLGIMLQSRMLNSIGDSYAQVVEVSGALERRVEERTAKLARTNERLNSELEKQKASEARVLESQSILKEQNINLVRKSIELSDIMRELEDKNYDLELSRSELQEVLAALRQSEKRYRDLFNNITDLIMTHDLEGRLLSVNPAVSKLSGYTVEELIGRPISDFITPKFQALFREEYLKGIKKQRHSAGIVIFQAKDGTDHYTEFRNVLVEEEGREPYVSGSGRDITERTLAEKVLRGAHDTLELKVKERTEALVQEIEERKQAEEERSRLEAQLQRSEKMEALGALAGGVAHDLNNILSGLVTYPEVLLFKIPQDSPLRKSILMIQKSGEKAAAVVQDLLSLARRGVVATEVMNLNDIILDYLKSLEYDKLKSYYPDVQVETNLETDLLNILGSSVHLSKTVMNLVSNAVEAIPGGGEIVISTENRYIDKPVTGYDNVTEGDYVVLTVSDTGIGISQTDMERIFEPFYTKKQMGRSGTGLGMAIVWGTVKDHQGYIDLQSIEGKGTTLTLYFPVTREELAKDESFPTMEDYMGKGESILVVDDIKEQRDLALAILTALDYTVNTVSSGEEAVEYLKEHTVDLVVLDMIMDPGIDGLDTYKRILELHPVQKAIISSGFSETERVREAQRLGAGAYVNKPYVRAKIGVAIRNELDKS